MRQTDTEEETNRREENIPISSPSAADFSLTCSACGTKARREFAKFCRVCGKLLREDYEPLDALRASYRLQGKPLHAASVVPIAAAQVAETINLFEKNENNFAESARALVVYSLVPYLGILFCPLAFFAGVCGVFVAFRKPYLGGGRRAGYSIAVSFIILGIQILLWGLLYLIPELGRRI